ncbi:MAG TPA: sucrase ferredoxin [Nocardioides sp.]|uniref:sucrase ferredoxin n=1 Tax=Nocardioides sp. TaxID=35761 RepID=UPI002E37DC84|nr:sucrase ferredoxin [Nocardioides sp.]HEX3932012.1 sucrase ferredoxin [Nocardioides sp.]
MSERCSVAARARGDELAGTATRVSSFLLVEDAGPWGEVALRDSRLPDDVAAWLRAQAEATRVRILLIRRPGRTTRTRPRVFAVRSGQWCERAELDRIDDVTTLDVAALAAGRSVGLEPWGEPLVLVCTHGRHDACCAERGRPLAAELGQIEPGRVWECSHLGGDRFAGNVLVLPEGLGFGRVDVAAAARLLADLDRGELDLDLLRGRCTLPMAAQYAEVQLRRELAEVRDDALRCTSLRRVDGLMRVAFEREGTTYDVSVRTVPGPPATLTCRAAGTNPVPRHEIMSVTTPAG